MQVSQGASDTWLACSGSGAIVASFSTSELLREWLANRQCNGVNYRLYHRRTNTVEISLVIPPVG